MWYVSVDIIHPDGTYFTHGEYFDELKDAIKYVKNYENGDPGDVVKLYINDTPYREFTVE